MYPEYEKINALFNRCDELDKTDKEFKDIFSFAFSFAKNNIAAYYFDDKKKLCKKKYKEVEAEIYQVAPKIAKLINGKKDDLVVLKIANSIYWVEYFYATLMAGYRTLLVDAKTSIENVLNLARQVKSKAIITDDGRRYKEIKTIPPLYNFDNALKSINKGYWEKGKIQGIGELYNPKEKIWTKSKWQNDKKKKWTGDDALSWTPEICGQSFYDK